MADNKMNQTNNPSEKKQGESMQREQGQSKTGERKPEQGGFDKNRKDEQGGFDKNRKDEQGREKSAIGGGQSGQSPSGQSGQRPMGEQSGQSQTGEPGRARSELDKDRSEPTSR